MDIALNSEYESGFLEHFKGTRGPAKGKPAWYHPLSTFAGTNGPLTAVTLIFLIALSSLPCRSQTFKATLLGTVTDQTGAVIPVASITVINDATGVATKTVSDSSGRYTLPSLLAGTYTFRVEKPGFRTTVISGITLSVDQIVHLDARLQLGQVRATVEVRGTTPLVQTSDSSLGTVVGERQVVDLPLNLRRPTALATLVPGTVSASSFGYAAYIVGGSPFSEATYVAGGARDSSNTLLIDGMESRAYDTGGFALSPPPDAVQEFKVQTNRYSAEFGKTAGSTMNLITKSGTNRFHGDAYDFLRNDKLDARNFFASNQTNPLTGQEIPGSARPEYRRNQFGFTFGGPIQKDKTFFFGYYDALREIKGLTLGHTVPTDAEKQGDFSSVLTGQMMNLCGANGPANLNFDSGQLFYPATESLFTCPAGSGNSGSTILIGTPISGNIITSINPVAQKVLAEYPEPNRPGVPNYTNQTPRVRADNQFGVRIDHSFSAKDRIFGRYMFAQSNITDPSAGYTSLPGFGDKIFFRGQNIILNWTHVFGANLLNEASVGFERNNPVENCEQCPRAAGFEENFGISGLKSIGGGIEHFPFFGLSNFAGVGDAGYRPISNVEMLEDYRDDLTWMRGRQTIIIGTDLQWLQNLRQQNPFSPGGQFSFDGRYSSLANEIPGASGVSDLADLILGFPASAARTLLYRDVNQVGSTFWSFYGQDNIRATRNLSINIGLRYTYERAPVDKADNIVSLLPLGAPFSGPGNAALITATSDAENDALCTDPFYAYLKSSSGQCLVLSSSLRRQMGFNGRTRRTLVFPYRLDFAPRFGLTWRPFHSDRFVLRSGYGIFYDLSNLNVLEFVSSNAIFSPAPQYTPPFGTPPPLTAGLPTTFDNVFAASTIPPLSEQYQGLWVDPHTQPPRVQEWSFGFESQLSQNLALDLSYVGETAHHLDNFHAAGNQPKPGVGSLQSRRPYPDFNVLNYFTPDDISNYNALQAKLTKRFSSGFLFLTSYTWGKTMDNGEGNEGNFGANNFAQDDNNFGANYARGVSDARQRLVLSGVWQLPIGKGRRLLNRTGLVDSVLSNWETSGILSLQSGFPISVFSAQDFSNTGSASPRPDRVCSGVGKKTVESWFDTSCFATAGLQQALASGDPRFGNSGRNILDGPGLADVDLALIKDFSIKEYVQAQFRAEAYNLLNRPNFGNPDSTIGTANVGIIGSAADPREIQFGLKLIF